MANIIKATIAALPLMLGACASDDLASFADGLQTFATALDAEVNACPPGMLRQTTYVQLAPMNGYSPPPTGPVTYYGVTPYQVNSYCAYPVVYTGRDHHHDHHDRGRDDHGRDGRRDDDRRDGDRRRD